MALKTAMLKSGFLVNLSIVKRGGTRTRTRRLGSTTEETGAVIVDTETTRTIYDPAEHDLATKTVGVLGYSVRKCCSWSPFGLLCSEQDMPNLRTAVETAENMAKDFNRASRYTKISVYCVVSQPVSPEELTRGVAAELARILDEVKAGIDSADPKRIIDAVKAAQEISPMLENDMAGQVSDAIAEARKAARDIKRRIVKKGEDSLAVLAELKSTAIETARFAFLEISGQATETPENASAELPSVDLARFAGLLDVEPTPDETPAEAKPDASTEETPLLPDFMYKKLDETEESKFRQWARDNFEPGKAPDPAWHPVTRDEWSKLQASS